MTYSQINHPKGWGFLDKKGEPHCPKCKDTAKPRLISDSLVYDCDGCGDQITSSAIQYWKSGGKPNSSHS